MTRTPARPAPADPVGSTGPRPAHATGARPARRLARVLAATTAWSALHLLLALGWLLRPGSRPGLDADVGFGATAFLSPATTAWSVLGLAVAGLALGIAARRRGPSPGLVVAMAAEAASLAVLSADLRLLVLLGYLCAIGGPAAVLVLFLAGAVRDRRYVPWLLVVLAGVAAGLATGVLRPATVGALAAQLTAAFTGEGLLRVHLALLLGGAVLWAAAAVGVRRAATGRCATCGRPGARWTEPDAVLRWGRVATWIAAAGPLPYVAMRATWLTPWPLGLPTDQPLDPATRLFGLALGAAALGGAVLTVGLLRPWGETWPGWVPVLRGRPVPVAVPVVTGGLVAAVLLAATPALLGQGIGGLLAGDLMSASFLVLFPTLPWGLALAAAVAAYASRRRGVCRSCGLGVRP